MRRTIKTAVVALVAVVALTGCIPGLSNPWQKARGPAPAQVQLGPAPLCDECITAPWEEMAGRDLLVEHSATPDIEFKVQTPIIPPDGNRRVAWVQATTNPDGSMRHVTIWYDPTLPDQLTVEMLEHELGHALGFRTTDTDRVGTGYTGVMSYEGFWTTRAGWFGDQDWEMMSGYRSQDPAS